MTKMFTICVVISFILAFSVPAARADQSANAPPPVAQTLVREGLLATKLAQQLQLTVSDDEAQAEDALAAVGIEPHGGWISNYPVTPVVLGQLQTSLEMAASSGRLSMSKSDALDALSNVASEERLPVHPADSSYAQSASSDQYQYQDQGAVDSTYEDEGPPVVSYYSPPWDYAYLYDWVPYPFWYGSFFFPGFFILTDFDVVVHDHHHHGHFDHDHDFHHVTNHMFDRFGHSLSVNGANLNRVSVAKKEGNPTSSRFGTFNAQNTKSARSIFDRDSTRFGSVSRDLDKGVNTAVSGTSSIGSSKSAPARGGESLLAGGMATNHTFTGSRPSEVNAGRSGFVGGSHMGVGFSGGMAHGSFSGGFGHAVGFGHGGFGGGFGHSGGFGAGFAHSGGFGGGFAHGGGFHR